MPPTPASAQALRPHAEKLLARLEVIPDADDHLLYGLGSITVGRLIKQLREYRPLGQTFIQEYMRPGRKFRKIVDTRLAELEERYGLSTPPGSLHSQVRIRR